MANDNNVNDGQGYEERRDENALRRSERAQWFRERYGKKFNKPPSLFVVWDVETSPVSAEAVRQLGGDFAKLFPQQDDPARPCCLVGADVNEVDRHRSQRGLSSGQVVVVRDDYCPNHLVKLYLFDASPDRFDERSRGRAAFCAVARERVDPHGPGPGRIKRCLFDTFFKCFEENVKRTGSPLGEPPAKIFRSAGYLRSRREGIHIQLMDPRKPMFERVP